MFKPSESVVTEDQYITTHFVDSGSLGDRLDAFLKERYRKRSRVQIQRAIEEGSVFVRRTQSPHLMIGKLKASTPLIPGDEVLVVSEKKPEPDVCFDYSILFQDDVIVVINKPANLPVHPAGRYFFNTLLIHLRTHGTDGNQKTPEIKAEREYFLPHRIDKETSGVMVLARDRDVCAHLVEQFASRTTQKTYIALVHGVAPERFESRASLAKDPLSPIEVKMGVVNEGLSAYTEFERLRISRDTRFSLVRCLPHTGRQHQIRVHLEHCGHPIVGDKLYGMPVEEALRYYERKHLSPESQARLILPRHALHAAELEFTHPLTQERLRFTAPVPAEFEQLL